MVTAVLARGIKNGSFSTDKPYTGDHVLAEEMTSIAPSTRRYKEMVRRGKKGTNRGTYTPFILSIGHFTK